jgi:6-phosphogluconate dehydrogenase
MKIGFIGLGRMGSAIVRHLVEEGVELVVYNRTKEKMDELVAEFANSRITKQELRSKNNIIHNSKFVIHNLGGELIGCNNVKELIHLLPEPRIVWLMVPHGKPVDEMIEQLLKAGLTKGDIVVDGGNSFYKDTIRRYKTLKKAGINYFDCGTSGGLKGAREGACLMAGGDREIYEKLEPVMKKMAGSRGTVNYFGPTGAGHFVKMVHNGVEYGMLQSIGEGFEILNNGPYKLDMHEVAANWTKGSVVRGWLMDLLEKALRDKEAIVRVSGNVGGGETGEWTVETAREYKAETPVIKASLQARFASLKKATFSGKIIQILRNQFGGHEIRITK